MHEILELSGNTSQSKISPNHPDRVKAGQEYGAEAASHVTLVPNRIPNAKNEQNTSSHVVWQETTAWDTGTYVVLIQNMTNFCCDVDQAFFLHD